MRILPIMLGKRSSFQAELKTEILKKISQVHKPENENIKWWESERQKPNDI